MGDSRAYPLFRNAGAADTLTPARRLCSLMEKRGPIVEPTAEHTVFVHLSKFGDLLRAEWPARQVGAKVLGEPVPGR